jgi:hypothetical protein
MRFDGIFEEMGIVKIDAPICSDVPYGVAAEVEQSGRNSTWSSFAA